MSQIHSVHGQGGRRSFPRTRPTGSDRCAAMAHETDGGALRVPWALRCRTTPSTRATTASAPGAPAAPLPRRTGAVLRHLRFRDLRYVCPARDVTRRGTPTAQVRNTGPPTVYVTVDGRGEAVPEAPAALLLHGPCLRTPWYPSGSLLCERARVGRVTDCHAVSPKTLFARAEDDRDQDVSRKPDRPQSAGSTTCVPPPVSSTRCSRMLSDRAVLVRIGRLRGRDPQPAVTAAESSEVR